MAVLIPLVAWSQSASEKGKQILEEFDLLFTTLNSLIFPSSINPASSLDGGTSSFFAPADTFSVTPETLGHTMDDRVDRLTTMIDGYFAQDAHHLNVNVLNRQKLIDAMNDPTLYPTLTIRVSGYAVNFNKLTREKQEEVISRTFHEKL